MVTAHDIAALCAAIDAGDDSALPVLADALEEAGDGRAKGLRDILWYGDIMPIRRNGLYAETLWAWEPTRGRGPHLPHRVRRSWFDRLPPLNAPGRVQAPAMTYPTRSAAYLALAAALAGE